jgi:hypothetical protein
MGIGVVRVVRKEFCVYMEGREVMVNLPLSTSRKRPEGTDVQLYSLSTSLLDGDEWSPSRCDRFTTGKNPVTHWLGGSVGLRPNLDDLMKRKISYPC